MPMYPTGGQFGSSPYNNPQMNQMSGWPQPVDPGHSMPPQGPSMDFSGGAWGGGPWGGGGPPTQANQAKSGQSQQRGQPGQTPWMENYLQGNAVGQYGSPGGGYSGVPSYQGGGYNQNSPQEQWASGHAPNEAAWQGGYGGGSPGRMGQELMWNSKTGEWEYVNDPSGLGFGVGASGNTMGTGNVSWVDPETGMRMVDPTALQGMFGGRGGQGGNQGYQNYQGSSYSGGDVTPGEGYQGYEYQQSNVDPSAVIAAQEYKLQETMEGDMARAGGRAGQSGFAMSTPYANQLGEAARKASQDRNALTMQYQYDAAQADANRQQQQQMQAAQADFGGWQTGYGGDLQAQMFNEGQGFQGWLAGEQMGMQNNQGQNAWNMQQNQQNMNQQNMNQQLMMQLMGGLF